jgi:hypothetical protein
MHNTCHGDLFWYLIGTIELFFFTGVGWYEHYDEKRQKKSKF